MIAAMNFKALPLALTLILAVAVLAACGGDDDSTTAAVPTTEDVTVDQADLAPYPEDVRKEYLEGCYGASNNQKSLCECLLKSFEDTLPIDDFQALNNPEPGEPPPETPKATEDAANACVEETQQTQG